MNINFSGAKIIGSNVTVVNGRVIDSNNSQNSKMKDVDFIKTHDSKHTKNLYIESGIADVNIMVSDTSTIQAHLSGQVLSHCNLSLEVFTVGKNEDDLFFLVKSSCDNYNNNAQLDVLIPYKVFNKIAIQTESSDILLSKQVSAQELDPTTTSGDIKTDAKFAKASLSTISGDINLHTIAEKHISNLSISSVSGDVTVDLNSISSINLSAKTVSGEMTNTHKPEIGYNADLNIITISGDITII